MACIRGIVNGGPLDRNCPNFHEYGTERHLISPREFTRRLHSQLRRSRNDGFETLHICGRSGYLLKATLLSHGGYTVVIKATTAQKEQNLRREVDTYRRLRNLQGPPIPVCLGDFEPRITYWYHGQPMAYMMILSWSGTRIQNIINPQNSDLFHRERERGLKTLRLQGAVHGNSEWRNMLWDDEVGCLIVIDLEDVKWLKRPVESTSDNTTPGSHRGHRGIFGQTQVLSSTLCGSFFFL